MLLKEVQYPGVKRRVQASGREIEAKQQTTSTSAATTSVVVATHTTGKFRNVFYTVNSVMHSLSLSLSLSGSPILEGPHTLSISVSQSPHRYTLPLSPSHTHTHTHTHASYRYASQTKSLNDFRTKKEM